MEPHPDLLHLFHAFADRNRQLLTLLRAFDADPSRLRRADQATLDGLGVSPALYARLQASDPRAVERDLEWSALDGNRILSCLDPDYPALLGEIDDPPVLLYLQGNPELLRAPQVALVGSRNNTPGGAQNARDFAAAFAAAGLAVTSGLALGIDSEAHRGALDVGGSTIAVLGSGIERIYPARNAGLADRIRESGLLVSEFPLQAEPARHRFPQRNRVISGLCIATLVIEAAERSGSLITARLAAEQGREVFALPGSIHNPLARGCHRLIRDGARLAESPDDLLDELAPLLNYVISAACEAPATAAPELDSGQQKLLDAIGYDPVDCDIIVHRSGLTIEQLSSMLPLLELNDLIRSAPGGCYVRI